MSFGTLQINTHRRIGSGEAVTVVIRPEDVVVSAGERPSNDSNTFTGEIQAGFFVGDGVDLRVRLGDDVIRAVGPGRMRFRRGDRVEVTLPPEACTLLRDEPSTGSVNEAVSV